MRTSSVNIAILEALQHENTHLTAQGVYECIRERLPAVNPSTVYRALERLAEAGQISVSDMGTGAAVYEAVTNGMHHHLVCQKCHRVLTLEHGDVATFFNVLENKTGFNISTNHLILFGICPDCR